MSGIEIAGLVLAFVPLLCGAFDASGGSLRGLRAAFRKRKYIEKLSRALRHHKQFLEETVRSVIVASGCENSGNFDERPMEYLRDHEVKERILDFLGPEAETAFIGSLQESKGIVEIIASHVEGLMPSPTVSSCANNTT